jgi:ATP-dependent Lon protease
MTTPKPRPSIVHGESHAYPVLPLRDIVVFPHMIVPLFVGREKSIRALEEVMKNRQADHAGDAEERVRRRSDDGFDLQPARWPACCSCSNCPTAPSRCWSRALARQGPKYSDRANITKPTARRSPTPIDKVEAEALARSVVTEFESYVKLNKKISPKSSAWSGRSTITPSSPTRRLASGRQDRRQAGDPGDASVTARLEKVLGLMESEISVLQVEKRIRSRVKRQMEKTQREYYLNEQMKAIQKELGDDDGRDELPSSKRRSRPKLSKEAREKAQHELKKLRQMSPMSAEATVVRNYLDWLLSIPWNKKSKVKKDLVARRAGVLDADHYGLEKVKDRIVEYLAVQQRANKLTGPILCLVGPPGVGKTSLGKSIAKATGREFVRVSLGGVRDEAEIRGHRRTYIGSMPGKIIQSMRKAKTSNPLFLLDEIDKMGADFRGDPSSALLEVLDPEQNSTFNDHYLEVDYDLSNVMFITTANTLNIPGPLMDRMEIIRIAGYTEDEKVEIARKHLIPNAIAKHGLDSKEWSIDDERAALMIRRYTREAGVRNLERELSTLARKAVKELMISKKKSVKVTEKNARGVSRRAEVPLRRDRERGSGRHRHGLAWTDVGGELLTIEGVMMPGKGKMTVTGNLRDVMKESISAAASYVRSRAVGFGIEPPLFDKRDIHVHVPEGATPKDGPSAGVAMATAIVSIMTGIPVRRRCRHDRRDHAARPRAADRRPEGEAAGRRARRHQDGADPGGQRQGSHGDQPMRSRAGMRSSRSPGWTT